MTEEDLEDSHMSPSMSARFKDVIKGLPLRVPYGPSRIASRSRCASIALDLLNIRPLSSWIWNHENQDGVGLCEASGMADVGGLKPYQPHYYLSYFFGFSLCQASPSQDSPVQGQVEQKMSLAIISVVFQNLV